MAKRLQNQSSKSNRNAKTTLASQKTLKAAKRSVEETKSDFKNPLQIQKENEGLDSKDHKIKLNSASKQGQISRSLRKSRDTREREMSSGNIKGDLEQPNLVYNTQDDRVSNRVLVSI